MQAQIDIILGRSCTMIATLVGPLTPAVGALLAEDGLYKGHHGGFGGSPLCTIVVGRVCLITMLSAVAILSRMCCCIRCFHSPYDGDTGSRLVVEGWRDAAHKTSAGFESEQVYKQLR